MFHTDLFRYRFIASRNPSNLLMIVLHGKGDSLNPFKKFNQELRLPGMNYLLLNAPRKYLDGFSWYGEPPYQHQGVRRNREKLFQLMQELDEQGWKSHNIFLLGFSQGCLVSADLALHYPKRFRGVIGVAGYFHLYPGWKRRVSRVSTKAPWLMLHGRKDDVLPIQDTLSGVLRLKKIGLDIDWIETNKRHVFEHDDYPVIRKFIKAQI